MGGHAPEYAPITLAISANDLKEWHKAVIIDTKNKFEQSIVEAKAETHVSPKKAAEIFDVDLSTLWRWQKKGYLVPIQVGGKRRYRMSDINRIIKGGNNDEK